MANNLERQAFQKGISNCRAMRFLIVAQKQSYERLKRGDVGELLNLHGLGHTLVCLRVARGLSQRELAGLLNVHESQVSRDERNEYHGITVERAAKILDAIHVRMHSAFEQPVRREVSPGAEAHL